MANVLKQTYLEAESPRHAWYQITMIQLTEGFVIEKCSGCQGRKPHIEAWFRWESLAANEVYDRILKTKTKLGRKRVYRKVQQRDQLELFRGNQDDK